MIQRAVIHCSLVIVALPALNLVPAVYSRGEMRSAALLGDIFIRLMGGLTSAVDVLGGQVFTETVP